MKNALIRLRENLSLMNQSQRAAAEYIIAHPDLVRSYTVYDLAKESFVSCATIVRMCKVLGFHGYKDFHRSLQTELAIQDEQLSLSAEDLTKDDSISDIIRKITFKNVQSLLETERLMDPDVLLQCVQLMRKAQRVLFFGLGASFIVARDFYLKLLRVNKECVLNEDWHLQLLSARNSTKDDVAIVFSYSGKTREIIECQKVLKDNQTPIIVITRPVETEVSKMATLELYTTANESLFRSAATSSRISQLNIIDVLYTAFANSEFDYSEKQYKKTHIQKG